MGEDIIAKFSKLAKKKEIGAIGEKEKEYKALCQEAVEILTQMSNINVIQPEEDVQYHGVTGILGKKQKEIDDVFFGIRNSAKGLELIEYFENDGWRKEFPDTPYHLRPIEERKAVRVYYDEYERKLKGLGAAIKNKEFKSEEAKLYAMYLVGIQEKIKEPYYLEVVTEEDVIGLCEKSIGCTLDELEEKMARILEEQEQGVGENSDQTRVVTSSEIGDVAKNAKAATLEEAMQAVTTEETELDGKEGQQTQGEQ